MFGSHLTGIYEKAFESGDSLEQRLGKAAELGFDFLEISIDETDQRLSRLWWDRRQIYQLRRNCERCGVPVSSMCLSGHRRFPFGSANRESRLKAYEIMDRAIDFAFELGIRVIQLAGYDVYYESSTPESRRLFMEGMRWAANRAARKQLMLAMEIMDTPFMNSITKYMGYEAMISSPWFRAYPDMGNLTAWPENDPDMEFAGGIKSIVGVHVKDTMQASGAFEGRFKGVDFGKGCVDFKRSFGQLEHLGYRGPYMVEMWYKPGSDDMEEVRRAQSWLEEQYIAGTGGRQEETCWKN